MTSNREESRIHMQALAKMVELRGGLSRLGWNGALGMFICWCILFTRWLPFGSWLMLALGKIYFQQWHSRPALISLPRPTVSLIPAYRFPTWPEETLRTGLGYTGICWTSYVTYGISPFRSPDQIIKSKRPNSCHPSTSQRQECLLSFRRDVWLKTACKHCRKLTHQRIKYSLSTSWPKPVVSRLSSISTACYQMDVKELEPWAAWKHSW